MRRMEHLHQTGLCLSVLLCSTIGVGVSQAWGAAPGIVNAAWLLERMPAAQHGLVLIDTRPRDQYDAGHLPGARWVDVDGYAADPDEDAALTGLRAHFEARFGAVGVTGSDTVVLYEQETGTRATRGGWLLEYLGHPAVRLLNGGVTAWTAAGGPVTQEVPRAPAGRFAARPTPEVLATAAYIQGRLGDRDFVVLDVRSEGEYRGTVERSHHKREGRIPGAIRVEWNVLLDDGVFKTGRVIAEIMGDHGITPETEIVTYCHSGARASNTFMALRAAGFRRVRTYIGSWHEWGNNEALPIERN